VSSPFPPRKELIMFKRIIIFTGLKIVEIAGIVFIPYYTGRLAVYLGLPQDGTPLWIVGLVMLIVSATVAAIACLLVQANWKYAKKLSERGDD